ncbi:hypothetical protein VUR80DRAFT_9078 [Thermomyces stellatus]
MAIQPWERYSSFPGVVKRPCRCSTAFVCKTSLDAFLRASATYQPPARSRCDRVVNRHAATPQGTSDMDSRLSMSASLSLEVTVHFLESALRALATPLGLCFPSHRTKRKSHMEKPGAGVPPATLILKSFPWHARLVISTDSGDPRRGSEPPNMRRRMQGRRDGWTPKMLSSRPGKSAKKRVDHPSAQRRSPWAEAPNPTLRGASAPGPNRHLLGGIQSRHRRPGDP